MFKRRLLFALATISGLNACGKSKSSSAVSAEKTPVCDIKFDQAVTDHSSQSLMGKSIEVFSVSARSTPMPAEGGESVGLTLSLSPSDTNETVDVGDTMIMTVAPAQDAEISGGDQIYLYLGHVTSRDTTAEGGTVSSVSALLKGTCTRGSTINVSSMTSDR